MTEETKKEGTETAPTTEEVNALKEQIDNLNKAVATSRDESKTNAEALKDAMTRLGAYEKEKEEAKKKDTTVELTSEDQKKFDAYAAQHGFLTKAELEVEKQKIASESATGIANTAISEFIEKHPEYDDDDMWGKVKAEFGQYRTPSDLAGYKKLFEKIHKDLSGGDKNRARAEVKADIAKNNHLKLGGKNQGGGSQEDEAAIEDYEKRYPNLSRDQIVARLGELKNLYPEKK